MSLFALTNHLFQKSAHVVNPCSHVARLEPASDIDTSWHIDTSWLDFDIDTSWLDLNQQMTTGSQQLKLSVRFFVFLFLISQF